MHSTLPRKDKAIFLFPPNCFGIFIRHRWTGGGGGQDFGNINFIHKSCCSIVKSDLNAEKHTHRATILPLCLLQSRTLQRRVCSQCLRILTSQSLSTVRQAFPPHFSTKPALPKVTADRHLLSTLTLFNVPTVTDRAFSVASK